MFTGADVKGSGGLSHICGVADIITGFIHDIGPAAIRTRGFHRAFSQLAGRFLRFFPCQLLDCVGSRVDQANHTHIPDDGVVTPKPVGPTTYSLHLSFGYNKSPPLFTRCERLSFDGAV